MSNIESGLYVVTLNNHHPISVNAHDLRYADTCIKVSSENCKFGRARNLEVRRRNYNKIFGKENVNYLPIVRMLDIEVAEKSILKKLNDYRMLGRTGRRNEWLEKIESNQLIIIVLATLKELGAEYELC